MSSTPVVYFLHGEDEVGINAFVSSMKQRLGDASTAEMNTTRFETRFDWNELRRVATAVPFLSTRRLVILEGVVGAMRSKDAQNEFIEFLEPLPESTALVIIERSSLKPKHWLVSWAAKRPDHAYLKHYEMLKGQQLIRWVQDFARKQGGEMLPQAAHHLIALIGDDNRRAATEVDKLLAYVNYARPVDIDDVELMTAPVQQADIFKMVDALGARNGRLALTLMHELLSERDAMSLFGMIIRQFRLLLQYAELQAENQTFAGIAREMNLKDFIVSKLSAQARNFDQRTLEQIYFQLTAMDDDMKNGRVDLEIALDTFVTSVTAR